VKRQVILSILLVPLVALALWLWMSPVPASVILTSLFDRRKVQVFPLEQTHSFTVVKESDVPQEFRCPNLSGEFIREVLEKDKARYLLRYPITRLEVWPMISTSGSRHLAVYARYNEAAPAPEGCFYIYDTEILSREIGVSFHAMRPWGETWPLPWEKEKTTK
jgi:hypothetical protein